MTALADAQEALRVHGMQREAEAFLAVAKVLEGRSTEQACSIMAAVAVALGFYDEAQAFVQFAKKAREFALEQEVRE